MKLSVFTALASAVAFAAAQDPGLPPYDPPTCAAMCFLKLYMENPSLMTCEEDNMYKCFCKSLILPLLYRECVCEDCPPEDQIPAVQYGLDTCEINDAPINWLPATCP